MSDRPNSAPASQPRIEEDDADGPGGVSYGGTTEGRHPSRGARVSVSEFAINHDPSAAALPAVQFAKGWDGWHKLPVSNVPVSALIATEVDLDRVSIEQVATGAEPLREGYEPYVLITTAGRSIVIDGNHRLAMHAALGHATMPAKVWDERLRGPITQAGGGGHCDSK